MSLLALIVHLLNPLAAAAPDSLLCQWHLQARPEPLRFSAQTLPLREKMLETLDAHATKKAFTPEDYLSAGDWLLGYQLLGLNPAEIEDRIGFLLSRSLARSPRLTKGAYARARDFEKAMDQGLGGDEAVPTLMSSEVDQAILLGLGYQIPMLAHHSMRPLSEKALKWSFAYQVAQLAGREADRLRALILFAGDESTRPLIFCDYASAVCDSRALFSSALLQLAELRREDADREAYSDKVLAFSLGAFLSRAVELGHERSRELLVELGRLDKFSPVLRIALMAGAYAPALGEDETLNRAIRTETPALFDEVELVEWGEDEGLALTALRLGEADRVREKAQFLLHRAQEEDDANLGFRMALGALRLYAHLGDSARIQEAMTASLKIGRERDPLPGDIRRFATAARRALYHGKHKRLRQQLRESFLQLAADVSRSTAVGKGLVRELSNAASKFERDPKLARDPVVMLAHDFGLTPKVTALSEARARFELLRDEVRRATGQKLRYHLSPAQRDIYFLQEGEPERGKLLRRGRGEALVKLGEELQAQGLFSTAYRTYLSAVLLDEARASH